MKNRKQLLASTPGGATIHRFPDGRYEVTYRDDVQGFVNLCMAWEMFTWWAEREARHKREAQEPAP